MVTAKPVGNNFCGVWRTAQGAALQPRVIDSRQRAQQAAERLSARRTVARDPVWCSPRRSEPRCSRVTSARTFAAPWLLTALAALPVIWWLLRVTPPAPRVISFPAIRLLLGLTPREETPARTPWWLILLRMVVAALIILALAHPLLARRHRVAR